jgi:hypothetical protein
MFVTQPEKKLIWLKEDDIAPDALLGQETHNLKKVETIQ